MMRDVAPAPRSFKPTFKAERRLSRLCHLPGWHKMNAEESMIIDTSSSGTPDEHESKALSEQPQGSKAAMEFSFELDPWQKQAVQCLEDNESVLVAVRFPDTNDRSILSA